MNYLLRPILMELLTKELVNNLSLIVPKLGSSIANKVGIRGIPSSLKKKQQIVTYLAKRSV